MLFAEFTAGKDSKEACPTETWCFAKGMWVFFIEILPILSVINTPMAGQKAVLSP